MAAEEVEAAQAAVESAAARAAADARTESASALADARAASGREVEAALLEAEGRWRALVRDEGARREAAERAVMQARGEMSAALKQLEELRGLYLGAQARRRPRGGAGAARARRLGDLGFALAVGAARVVARAG